MEQSFLRSDRRLDLEFFILGQSQQQNGLRGPMQVLINTFYTEEHFNDGWLLLDD